MIEPARDISVVDLDPQRISQAYPLVQTVMPDLDLDAWQHFALSLLQPPPVKSPQGGILTALNEGGFMVGLAIYRLVHDLRHGPVLLAEHLMALDLLDCKLVAQRLAVGLEGIASREGCRAVHITLSGATRTRTGDWLVGLLEDRGHQVQGVSLCKPMEPPAEALVAKGA